MAVPGLDIRKEREGSSLHPPALLYDAPMIFP
jgi:hypothetical protein